MVQVAGGDLLENGFSHEVRSTVEDTSNLRGGAQFLELKNDNASQPRKRYVCENCKFSQC